MKKLLFIMLLVGLAATLGAQTGLYGLSYGDSYQKAKGILEENESAFYLLSEDGAEHEFFSDSNVYVDKIILWIDEKTETLVSWQVYFLDQEDEDIEDLVIDSADEWHGAGAWNEEEECYVWSFDSKKRLRLGYNPDWWLVAEYTNDDYPQYSELLMW